ncbi:glycoside hydrolase family 3 protein [Jaapia argillacea MUCL 33604]|uniref:Glycoside hydrolase family 3 protein n=1 Tax=Jaapia argillacea MUCL 33604 TaxID=933084 RepID=A0A067PKZ0_9AGAM|nr:glycoside hydrolase family 3 protein [Jaapia argillacea MUCL 33604]
MSPSLTDEIKREIGQHFVFGFHGYDLSQDIVTLIRDYHLGNVILMKRNIHSMAQVYNLVIKLQQLAKDSGHAKPLLVGIDQENGLVSAFSSTESTKAGTQFPGAMALASTGSVQLCEEVSAATGKELRAVGINWAYSPVADINSDPRNPVIGVRSFGDDPQEVGKYVKATCNGLVSAGVAPCAKHFPGHGDTHVDSHLALPRILKPKENLLDTELRPFKALIDDDIPTIMTGHMAFPLVNGDDTPCSLSASITTQLLRDELGYNGVIVTDCLEMEAVVLKYGSEGGAVRSLQAGADIAMICHRIDRQLGAIEAACTAVSEGQLDIYALKESGERIGKLKDRFAGTWDDVLGREFVSAQVSRLSTENAALSLRAYAASTVLISDHHRLIPLPNTGGTIILFTPHKEKINPAVDDPESVSHTTDGKVKNTAGPSYNSFARTLSDRRHVEHIVYAKNEAIPPDLGTGTIIFATRNGHSSRWQLDYLLRLQDHVHVGLTRVIVVSTCAPYDALELSKTGVTCLATMEFTVPALDAAAAVIFGEQGGSGHLPVRGA